MNGFSKVVIALMILICGLWAKDTFLPNVSMDGILEKFNLKNKIEAIKPDVFNDELKLSEEGKKILGDTEEKKKIENTAKIFFLKINPDGTTKMYVSKRELNEITLTSVLKNLLKGPTAEEKRQGVYSEIPDGTKLIGLTESENKIIINLNSEFQYGGGTDSINNRLKQLVKTVMTIAPNKSLYLYIDGKQIDVIGGDGIMLTQPLNISEYN